MNEEVEGVFKTLEELTLDSTVTTDTFISRLDEILGHETMGEMFASATVGWTAGTAVAVKAGAIRANALAGALCDRADGPGTATWWAAGLFNGADDIDRAESVATDAFFETDPDDYDEAEASIVGEIRLELGKLADATELALSMCIADLDSHDAQELLSRSLHRMTYRQVDDLSLSAAVCYCGSELSWTDCCRKREEELLAHFADRSFIYSLREAVTAFVASNESLARWSEEYAAEWEEEFREVAMLGAFDSIDGRDPILDGAASANSLEGHLVLVTENSWGRGPDWDEADPRSGEEENDSHSILNRFADETTDVDLAEFARTWQASARYGFWQIADPMGRPGVWVTDLVTRRSLYASIPSEQLEELPRWSVLAGCFVPDQGVWRSGGAFRVLDPDEGDRVTEIAIAAAKTVIGGMAKEAGIKGAGKLRRAEPRLDDVPAHGMVAGYLDPMDPFTANLHHTVVSVGLAGMLGEVEELRRRGPRMCNTDGEPLEMLRATAHVDDPEKLRKLLRGRMEFSEDVGNEMFTWKGREMTAAESSASIAQIREMAKQKGLGPVEEVPGEPRHWIRGSLQVKGNQVSVDVNSQSRLDAICTILERLGVENPVVEHRFDPAMDMAIPAGWRPLARAGSPEAEEAWRNGWLDDNVPALGGITPRDAIKNPKSAIKLERLLRRFEFDSDLVRFQGERAIDVSKIRELLGDEDGNPFEM